MGLCQTTTEAGTGWGLIDATFALASGTGTPSPSSRSVRPAFGSGIAPRQGSAIAVLSTGTAAAPGQTNPAHNAFQTGSSTGLQSAAPADWLQANGGAFPVAPGCPPAFSANAVDPILLRLRVRVPVNARSFRLGLNFLGADYPEWVCGSVNDVVVVLVDSTYTGSPPNPADKNVARYLVGAAGYPLGVNLAVGNTGLFRQCLNGPIGCLAAT